MQIISTKEASLKYGISTRTIYEWISKGKLEKVTNQTKSKKIYIYESDLVLLHNNVSAYEAAKILGVQYQFFVKYATEKGALLLDNELKKTTKYYVKRDWLNTNAVEIINAYLNITQSMSLDEGMQLSHNDYYVFDRVEYGYLLSVDKSPYKVFSPASMDVTYVDVVTKVNGEQPSEYCECDVLDGWVVFKIHLSHKFNYSADVFRMLVEHAKKLQLTLYHYKEYLFVRCRNAMITTADNEQMYNVLRSCATHNSVWKNGLGQIVLDNCNTTIEVTLSSQLLSQLTDACKEGMSINHFIVNAIQDKLNGRES